MEIERSTLVEALLSFARAGHGLVVGQPGVGKSYSIAALGNRLKALGIPYLALAVEELGDCSEEDLRSQLGYSGNFADQLQALFATGPTGGIIILDGFDAARNAEVRARLIDLINRIVRQFPPNWALLVSVRNYDAARSPSLLELFPRRPNSRDEEGYRSLSIRARHFLIPELTVSEVNQAIAGFHAPFNLQELVDQRLGKLLRTPFNLWLLERVLEVGTALGDLTKLRSELQLLQLFWAKLVVDLPDADERLVLLKRATELMVERGRLDAPRVDVVTLGMNAAFGRLLSAEILTELGTAKERISFRHNLLFDFAVATLSISTDPEGVQAFVSADPARPLFLRPSLLYFFSLQWYERREDFWQTFWQLLESPSLPVRLVARLLPPVVLVSEAQTLEDLNPLLQRTALGSTGHQAALRVLQSLQFAEPSDFRLWLHFARALTEIPERTFAWELGQLLSRTQRSHYKDLSREEQEMLGEASGLLLDWVWSERARDQSGWFDHFGSIVVLPLVLETLGTRLETATKQVRRIFELLQEPAFPIRYFYALADGIEHVIRETPSLAAEVYRLIFGHTEESRSPTHMGGVVIRLTSNRQQDFEMCHYALGQAFSHFIIRSPLDAAPVALDVLNAVIIRERLVPYLRDGRSLEEMTETFEFRGKHCSFLPDLGGLWSGAHREEESQIADQLVAYSTGDAFSPDPVVLMDLLVEHALTASSWGVLLRTGAEAPSRFGAVLSELAIARPIQSSGDLYTKFRAFVQAGYPFWTVSERVAFERSLTLSRAGGVSKKAASQRLASLLKGLPNELIALSATRNLLSELGDVLDESALEQPHVTFSSQAYTQEDWLRDQGVDPESPANSPLRAVHDALGDFVDGSAKELPAEELKAVLSVIDRALQALRGDAAADEAVRASLWARLAAAATRIAKSQPAVATGPYRVTREVLLEAANQPVGTHGSDEEYDWPHWGPSARTAAIEGAAYLLHVACEEELADRFRGLAESADPAERFLVARYLPWIPQTCPDLYWEVMLRRAELETNAVAAAGLLETLAQVGTAHEELREPLVVQLTDRWLGAKHRDLTRMVAGWLQYYAINLNREWAWARMRQVVVDLPHTKELLGELNFAVINAITPKRLIEKPERDDVLRAQQWLVEVLRNLAVRASENRNQASSESASESRETLGAMHDLVGNIVSRIYFNIRRDGEEDPGNLSELKSIGLYYQAVVPILDAVIAFGSENGAGTVVPAGVHYLMQFFNVAVVVDPPGVLAKAASIALAGSKSGYHLDSLAIDEVVRLVETVLTDHREIVTGGVPLSDLLRLLDLFADAGWPQALRLVWRLDEVFR